MIYENRLSKSFGSKQFCEIFKSKSHPSVSELCCEYDIIIKGDGATEVAVAHTHIPNSSLKYEPKLCRTTSDLFVPNVEHKDGITRVYSDGGFEYRYDDAHNRILYIKHPKSDSIREYIYGGNDYSGGKVNSNTVIPQGQYKLKLDNGINDKVKIKVTDIKTQEVTMPNTKTSNICHKGIVKMLDAIDTSTYRSSIHTRLDYVMEPYKDDDTEFEYIDFSYNDTRVAVISKFNESSRDKYFSKPIPRGNNIISYRKQATVGIPPILHGVKDMVIAEINGDRYSFHDFRKLIPVEHLGPGFTYLKTNIKFEFTHHNNTLDNDFSCEVSIYDTDEDNKPGVVYPSFYVEYKDNIEVERYTISDKGFKIPLSFYIDGEYIIYEVVSKKLAVRSNIFDGYYGFKHIGALDENYIYNCIDDLDNKIRDVMYSGNLVLLPKFKNQQFPIELLSDKDNKDESLKAYRNKINNTIEKISGYFSKCVFNHFVMELQILHMIKKVVDYNFICENLELNPENPAGKILTYISKTPSSTELRIHTTSDAIKHKETGVDYIGIGVHVNAVITYGDSTRYTIVDIELHKSFVQVPANIKDEFSRYSYMVSDSNTNLAMISSKLDVQSIAMKSHDGDVISVDLAPPATYNINNLPNHKFASEPFYSESSVLVDLYNTYVKNINKLATCNKI